MTPEHMLNQSLNQYRQLLERLEEIGRKLQSGHASATGASLESWLELQKEARLTDAKIGEYQEREPASIPSSPGFEERQALMKKLAERCREVFSQASAHKALIRDELTRLRGGRIALSGYRTLPSGAGNRVSSRQ